jgi:hypothetical protein
MESGCLFALLKGGSVSCLNVLLVVHQDLFIRKLTLPQGRGDDSLSPCLEIVTWLILPVVICLSQRLSHACLSINEFIL